MGRTVRQHTVAGFVLSETIHSPRQKLQAHSHEFATFCLLLRGGFTETSRKGLRSCSPSTLIFRPPAEVHLNDFGSKGACCFNIALEPSRLRCASECLNLPKISSDFGRGLLSALALRIYREFQVMEAPSALMIEG